MGPPPPKKKSAPPSAPPSARQAPPLCSSLRVADFVAAFAGTGVSAADAAGFLAARRDEGAAVVVAVTKDGQKRVLPILPTADEPSVGATEEEEEGGAP